MNALVGSAGWGGGVGVGVRSLTKLPLKISGGLATSSVKVATMYMY